jgi:hypothetical protein
VQTPVSNTAGKHTSVDIASAKIRKPAEKTVRPYPTAESKMGIKQQIPHQHQMN